MSDPTTLSGPQLPALGRRAELLAQAQEVRARARVTRPDESPAERRALERLDRLLRSEEPLNRDVPRGYYLNIVV